MAPVGNFKRITASLSQPLGPKWRCRKGSDPDSWKVLAPAHGDVGLSVLRLHLLMLTPLPVGIVGIVAGEGESSGGPVRKPATRLRGLRGRAFFLMQSGVRQPDPPRHLPLSLIILSKPGV